jgi:hypothetical protein
MPRCTKSGPPKCRNLIPHRCQLNIERWLLPQCIDLLLSPVLAVSLECQVEVEKNLGQDDAHLMVSQA